MNNKRIRIGFIGLGGICRERHVPGLKRIDGVEIVAVANRSRESSEAAAREFGIPDICDSWRDLVARPDIDAVFIGTWPYMHREMSIAAIEAGKHVFCQARMAMNLEEARQMRDCAAASGLVAMLCPVPFGLSVDATIARLTREGYLGEPRLVRVQSLSNVFIDPKTPMNWRKDRRLSGLNTLTLGMFIEVIHRWFGRTQSVSADADIFTTERRDASGELQRVEVPDQLLINTRMKAGFPVQYVFSSVTPNGGDFIEVYGTKAALRYDVAKDVLFAAKQGELFAPVVIEPKDAYDERNWRVERDFIEAVRHGAEYHPNFDDGLRYMAVIQAVFDSIASGARVEVE